MCDVHLLRDVDELRRATQKLRCGECERPIRKGTEYRYIEGALDDGSGERWQYIAHEDCYLISKTDVSADGCFTFGGAVPVHTPVASLKARR